jgi:hypothetical protein
MCVLSARVRDRVTYTAKVAHTVLLEGQHDGHLAPGVYTGSVPGSQNPSSPKHSHVWSLVSLMPLPGQQALSHLQSGVVQFGHSVWHRDSVGSTAGGSQNPIAVGKECWGGERWWREG